MLDNFPASPAPDVVAQWKQHARESLPEVFAANTSSPASDHEAEVEALHARTGRVPVDNRLRAIHRKPGTQRGLRKLRHCFGFYFRSLYLVARKYDFTSAMAERIAASRESPSR